MSSEPGERLNANALPVPRKTLDAAPYWRGVEEDRLLFQRCTATGRAIFPPRRESPAGVRGGDLVWEESCGRGTVYSYSTVVRPPMAVFESRVPYTLGLIKMQEGYFMFAEIDAPAELIAIGKPVVVSFPKREPKLPVFQLA